MKTSIIRLLTFIFIISALSVNGQATYNITANQVWSNNGVNNQIPNPCYDCVINVSEGVVVTVEKDVTLQGVTFTGGRLVFSKGSLMLWGSPDKKNRFNRVNMVFSGSRMLTLNGPMMLDNSTVTFNENANMLVNHPLEASSSRLYFNGNSHLLGQNKVTLANTQIVVGDGLLSSKAYVFMNGHKLTLNDVTSGINVSNTNNYYANWQSYYSVPSGRSISTTENKLNCGVAGKNSCRAEFVYGPIAVTSSGLAAQLILPVVITNFTATATANKVNLSWTTQQESNSSHFLVERSNDGSGWTAVDNIKAAGNSSVARNYHTSDVAPVNGVAHYRLKMVDQDGKFAYSATKSVRTNAVAAMKVYPNPAIESVNITLDARSGKTTIKLFNQNGQLMIAKNIAANTNLTTLPVQQYPNGNYVISITNENGTTQTSKILIQHN